MKTIFRDIHWIPPLQQEILVTSPEVEMNPPEEILTIPQKATEQQVSQPAETTFEPITILEQAAPIEMQPVQSSPKEAFKQVMLPIYEKVLLSYGLDPLYAKSLVAQDALESAWGTKQSGRFNFGGIKDFSGKGTSRRTKEVINGKTVSTRARFRDFGSLDDYARYKVNLLNSNRYKAFSGKISEFADRVAKGGYATDPKYAEKLNKMIATARHGMKLKADNGIQVPPIMSPEARRWMYDKNGEYAGYKRRKQKYPEFWDRLRDPNREHIIDWEDPSKTATHKMGYAEVDGKYVVFPSVQKVGDRLIDFSGFPFNERAALDNALRTGNYAVAPNESVAAEFSKNYKQHYPGFQEHDVFSNEMLRNTFHSKSDRIDYIYRKLLNSGYNNIQASAIIGSLFVEGQFDENKKEIGGKGEGILQWTNPDRKKRMREFVSPTATNEFERQVDYLIYELQGSEWDKGARDKFMKETDINKASDIFTRHFCRPSKPNDDLRREAARYYVDKAPDSDMIPKWAPIFKHGGTLKFQPGGAIDAREWVRGWYRNRIPLLHKNTKDYLPIPVPTTGALVYNIYSHHLDMTSANVKPDKVPEGEDGIFKSFGRRIYLRSDSPSAAVREWVVSSGPDGQSHAIKQIKSKLGDKFFDKSSPDEKLDDPEDIYARMMQFRHYVNADPKHVFTKDEIEKLKEDPTEKKFNILDRYSTDALYLMLNTVASANTVKKEKGT